MTVTTSDSVTFTREEKDGRVATFIGGKRQELAEDDPTGRQLATAAFDALFSGLDDPVDDVTESVSIEQFDAEFGSGRGDSAEFDRLQRKRVTETVTADDFDAAFRTA